MPVEEILSRILLCGTHTHGATLLGSGSKVDKGVVKEPITQIEEYTNPPTHPSQSQLLLYVFCFQHLYEQSCFSLTLAVG